MRLVVVFAALLFSTAAQAQYKCTVNGKTAYSDVPCAANARYVGALEDNVSSQSRADAEAFRRRQAAQRRAIERSEAIQADRNQRAVNNQLAAEAAQARANEAARQRNCANLESAMRQNQRRIAVGQDIGWQRTISQNEAELKQNREAYEHNCR